MDDVVDIDLTSIIFRPIEQHEQQKAIDMWYAIFRANPGFYERYFSPDASPLYRHGDALGAWHNERLVSTVYIRRLTLRSNENDQRYQCAGIANVATLPEYRRHSLSRQLLKLALKQMEESNEFDISFLGTEKQGHYLPLGWEPMPEPTQITINWKISSLSEPDRQIDWRSVSDVFTNDLERLSKIYHEQPRLYQLDRSPISVFQTWVKWEWMNDTAIIYLDDCNGYVVVGKPDDPKHVCILEWRAGNLAIEHKLLNLAAAEIQRRHGTDEPIRLFTLPQHMTVDQLNEWVGPVQTAINPDSMVRNIRLPNETYQRIKMAFSDGRATFWSGDFF